MPQVWKSQCHTTTVCGWNHPSKTSWMNQWFSRQMKGISIPGSLISDFFFFYSHTPCFCFLSKRVRRLLLPSDATEVFEPNRRLLVPLSSHDKPNLKRYRLHNQPTFNMGILRCLFHWLSVIMPAASLKNVFKFSQTSCPSGDKRAFLPFLEAVGWWGWLDCFGGSWASFGFPWEHWGLPRFPQQLDHTLPVPRLSSFTLHGHQSLPLACSLGCSCHLPACLPCSLLLPSYFSRWSLVWFCCPNTFTRWCFGCSRGKQVSVLCFYYFPD